MPCTRSLAAALLTLAMPACAQNLFFGSAGYAGTWGALFTSDLDGLGVTDILTTPQVVTGVAADGANNRVFWKNHLTGGINGQYTLHASDLTGGSHAVIASWTGAGNNYGVAADRINQRVYWTDLLGVHSSNYDGSGATMVVASPNAEDVEVDPAAGKMFWVDSWGGSSVTLNVANLNGSSPQTLVTLPGTTVVSGLTVNPGTQTVYWSDYTGGTISTVPYGGGAIGTVLSGSPGVAGLEYEPVSNRLYIASKGAGSVSWIPPGGGARTTVYTDPGPVRAELWDVAAIVPAPGSLALIGMAGLLAVRRRRP